MLVLSRKCDESIYIGDDVKITVVRIDGRTVRLGLEAPRSVVILREEIYHKQAALPANDDGIQASSISTTDITPEEAC